MSEQANFIKHLQQFGNQMDNLGIAARKLYSLYFANGFDSGLESKHILESGLNTDSSEIVAMITLIENFKNFLDGGSATKANYQITLDKFRSIDIPIKRPF